MIQLSQKERMILQDLKGQEELCIVKYKKYSEQAQETQLKQLLNTISTQEQKHYDTVNGMLQGQEPNMGGQQQQGQGQGQQQWSQQQQYQGMSNTADKLLIRRMIERFLLLYAREYLQARFAELTAKYSDMGFNPSGLVVKPLKSRWGSCSSKGKITLSSELVKLDPVYADYVILHELCHLKHHNHGKEFYLLLGRLFPGYKHIQKEIRQYITK
jgi:predicted metal-dependent hydrolase